MMYFGKCRSKDKGSENDLEWSNSQKVIKLHIVGKEMVSSSNGTKVLKISWLLFELKYMLCPKVKNFENFQKSLKCCSFINNGDTELKLGVC